MTGGKQIDSRWVLLRGLRGRNVEVTFRSGNWNWDPQLRVGVLVEKPDEGYFVRGNEGGEIQIPLKHLDSRSEGVEDYQLGVNLTNSLAYQGGVPEI